MRRKEGGDARMNPALSIIFFSTASGAGFGLLLLLGIAAPLGLVPQNAGFAFVSLAVVLAGGGLLASPRHPGRRGRPGRASRKGATSGLSRGGVSWGLPFAPA